MAHILERLFISIMFIMAIALIMFNNPAYAVKKKINFVSVSWTGVTVKTELGAAILNSLGYKATNRTVSVPIAYQALEKGDADIFMGNWMPSMESIANKFFEKGSVIKFVSNMTDAQYTLAAPSYVVDGGLKDFSDIVRFADKLDHKIYGIEEGNDGNLIIQDMIDNNMFGLKDFELVASSEAGMLAQVMSYAKKEKWIVFLGWSPHYMNEVIDMKYLTGSTSETFGENGGTATVFTNIRRGFDKEYPNVAAFLKNYRFPVSMMNEIMTMLHSNEDLTPLAAGIKWLIANPETYESWLMGIKTVDGKSGIDAFRAYLDDQED